MNVVICGSLAHPDLIEVAVAAERAAGRTVLAYPTDDGMPAGEAARLWRQHIDAADEVVFVRKPDGTIGRTVRGELAYAAGRGKALREAEILEEA